MFGGCLFLKLIIFQHWVNNGSKKNRNKIIKNGSDRPWHSLSMLELNQYHSGFQNYANSKRNQVKTVECCVKKFPSRGILCSSFMNLSLTLENVSSLVSWGPGPAASVLLPDTSGATLGAGFPTRASLRLIAGCGSQAEANQEKTKEGYSLYLEY